LFFGLLCLAIGIAGSIWLWQQPFNSATLLKATRTIQRGETIQAADLEPVRVQQPNPILKLVTADQLDSLVGRQALVDIGQNALLIRGEIGDFPVPDGYSAIGIKLAAGHAPMTGLEPGARIRLVQILDQDAGSPRQFDATILLEPETMTDGSTRSLSVVVSAAEAPKIAALAVAQRLAVTIIG
jgi:hypothetical protein